MSEVNLKRLVAYLIWTLCSVFIAGGVALAVSVLGASGLGIAGAGGASFIALLGLGVKVIGPFEFTASKAETPPIETQPGAPSP
ncbi:hypothetical protein OG824_13770 [Streptomyces prunicolor]|uniref:hypothetical protein n=1 Tax=Streptomyces prunicolor TaxID=67348 RepID=UPI002259F1C0|nr:hypothetical protein [Streptomyces prunicolor]MCX5236269.1 hypothetical protein [Streptomyces prunicolor]